VRQPFLAPGPGGFAVGTSDLVTLGSLPVLAEPAALVAASGTCDLVAPVEAVAP
jgi:hypothetical protein